MPAHGCPTPQAVALRRSAAELRRVARYLDDLARKVGPVLPAAAFEGPARPDIDRDITTVERQTAGTRDDLFRLAAHLEREADALPGVDGDCEPARGPVASTL